MAVSLAEKYVLRCTQCGREHEDHFTNACESGHNALLRTDYRKRRIEIRRVPGMFRFSDWLPVRGTLPVDAGPVTFQSSELGKELGLSSLFIGFSGYWPERKGQALTCSFKELEAFPTMLRLRERNPGGVLVVASAGNTARAFAQASGLTGMPVVLVVPEASLHRLWTTVPAERVYLVAVRGDYSDAIAFSQSLTTAQPLIPEGGAKNAARRDGMGTVMLDAAVTIGRMPGHYFQAVGSGTGGIAAWEAAIRLRADGRFGDTLPHLHLSQNLPFVPMASAFREGRREILPERDMPDAKAAIAQVYSEMLTNRNPPYGICGGTYDALVATGGRMYAVTNDEARSAANLFSQLEGIDPDPAAAVAVASLIRACDDGAIGKNDTVLINITGGGYDRVREDHPLIPVGVAATVSAGAGSDTVQRDLMEWVNTDA
jgi:cysteate synthase